MSSVPVRALSSESAISSSAVSGQTVAAGPVSRSPSPTIRAAWHTAVEAMTPAARPLPLGVRGVLLAGSATERDADGDGGVCSPVRGGGVAETGPPGRAAGPPGRAAGPPGRAAGPPGRAAGPPGRAAGPPGRAAGLSGMSVGMVFPSFR
ncbi:hypothetical protein GCM10010392_33600 [Streptomyces clavifer]|nr:hypothetical protein GCM10010392_33600 [Streptomyces clavifer]